MDSEHLAASSYDFEVGLASLSHFQFIMVDASIVHGIKPTIYKLYEIA